MDGLLTQKELACKAGVSEFTVTRAEAGQTISFSTLKKLACALGKPPELLAQEAN